MFNEMEQFQFKQYKQGSFHHFPIHVITVNTKIESSGYAYKTRVAESVSFILFNRATLTTALFYFWYVLCSDLTYIQIQKVQMSRMIKS